MASINSVSGSSSTIGNYTNRISGLASGLDTEGLIENSVSGLKLKINSLQQKRQKVEWQQESYRSIISKLSSFTNKYASYTSATNLMSNSFFDSSVLVSSQGKYADKVSASGKSSSSVELLGVKQLATAASYTLSGAAMGKNLGLTTNGSNTKAVASGVMNLAGDTTVGTLEGDMTLKYGNMSVNLTFDKGEVYKSAEDLAKAMQEKLSQESITISGTTYKASEKIGVSVKDGTINVFEIGNAGNTVAISGASASIKNALGLNTSDSENLPKSFSVDSSKLTQTGSTADYLTGATMSVTIDGVTKTIKVPQMDMSQYEAAKTDEDKAAALEKIETSFVQQLQAAIDSKFGSGKLTVGKQDAEGGMKLTFESHQVGTSFQVTSKENSALGLGSTGVTSYLDVSKTLGDLMGEDYFKDENGKNTAKDLVINGVKIGTYTKDTALDAIMNAINANTEVGVDLTYSKTTNQFRFEAEDTGVAGNMDFGDADSFAAQLFGGGTMTEGQDAILTMRVNGVLMEDVSRSTNAVSVDGLTMNLKGTFGYETEPAEKKTLDNGKTIYKADKPMQVTNYYGNTITAEYVDEDGYYVDGKNGARYLMRDAANVDENGQAAVIGGYYEGQPKFNRVADTEAVTFSTEADADKIVDAIKQMVEDYNAMATEIKKAYSTMPEQKSSGAYYEPLTDEDKEGMSESAINSYEEKAKAGILFGDRDLSTLYNQMLNAVQGAGLEDIGITLSYSDGLTTLSLNESQLRTSLASDPDKVRDVFTRSKDSGASSNGLMQALKIPLEKYGKTSGTKGILVEKAGSPLAASTLYNNDLYDELCDIDEDITKVQDQISDQIDYYTNKFTYLEQLIAQMNNQSSMLMGLTG